MSRLGLVYYHVSDYCVVVPYGASKGSFADLFIVSVHTRVFAAIGYQRVKAIANYSQIPSKVTVRETRADAREDSRAGVQFLGNRTDCFKKPGICIRYSWRKSHYGLYFHTGMLN